MPFINITCPNCKTATGYDTENNWQLPIEHYCTSCKTKTPIEEALFITLSLLNEKLQRSRQAHRAALGIITKLTESDFLTGKQVADLSGYSPASIVTMRSRGGGPAFYKLGKKRLYKKSDVLKWIGSKRVE